MYIDVDDEGLIVNEYLMANRWLGYTVINLKELKDHKVELVQIKKDRQPKQLIYPVEQVEIL